MKKLTVLLGLICLLSISSTYADEAAVEASATMQVDMQMKMSDEEKQEKDEERENKKAEMLENKEERVEQREEYRETITGLRDEARELRAERKVARQEFISAARENLIARIEAKWAHLSQISQDKLVNASERIEKMVVKYEENEKLSDEIKNVILDQLYALLTYTKK